MVPWWLLAVLIVGVNVLLWGVVGLLRLAEGLASRLMHRRVARGSDDRAATRAGSGNAGSHALGLTVDDVAVLIPAHNEAAVIGESLRAIMRLVPPANVHVVSDGSTDATTRIAESSGAQVIATVRNVGKAGALQEAIQRFRLIERFRVVLLLDADTRIDPGYMAAALPMFDRPDVVAVAGRVKTDRGRKLSLIGNILTAHRQRIYGFGQRALKYGQTWHHLNATHIVPGFASMYLTRVLPRIEMNPPGLVIEDFNMTFEVYQKRLGKVAFTMGAVAVTQDPDNLRDYVRQTKRWALGLWQTVRRHPPRRNLFTAMLTLLLLELVTSSVLFLLTPFVLVTLLVPEVARSSLDLQWFAQVHGFVHARVSLTTLLYGIVLPDCAVTCVIAVVERRPRLLICGFAFLPMRLIDSAIGLYTLPMAWLSKSDGRWKSPVRRAVGAPALTRRPVLYVRPAAAVPDGWRTGAGPPR